MTGADYPENATCREVMPKGDVVSCIQAEQPAAERTIAHLYAERIAMPVHATGEMPGYHPNHSKSKCLPTSERPARYGTHPFFTSTVRTCPTPVQYHVIDYYIYGLEHILI